jgi:hypothetical protein
MSASAPEVTRTNLHQVKWPTINRLRTFHNFGNGLVSSKAITKRASWFRAPFENIHYFFGHI